MVSTGEEDVTNMWETVITKKKKKIQPEIIGRISGTYGQTLYTEIEPPIMEINFQIGILNTR